MMPQIPLGVQQTPGGTEDGQGFGVQTVNSACQIVGSSSVVTHLNSAVSTQVPLRSQQAPDGGCGQIVGVQVSHPMFQTDGSAQAP
jgi:hypothetical protein